MENNSRTQIEFFGRDKTSYSWGAQITPWQIESAQETLSIIIFIGTNNKKEEDTSTTKAMQVRYRNTPVILRLAVAIHCGEGRGGACYICYFQASPPFNPPPPSEFFAANFGGGGSGGGGGMSGIFIFMLFYFSFFPIFIEWKS